TAASSILITSAGGIPSLGTALPDGITATTQSASDNSTKVATTAYVDSAVLLEDLWDRVTGPPNYVIPNTAADDIGATAARITKGWFTNLESTNAPTVSGAACYYAGGTDVSVTDGGTGLSVYAIGDIVYASNTTTLAGLADVAVGSVLISGGVGVAPAWSTDMATGVTIGTKYIYRTGGTDVPVADGGTNSSAALGNGLMMVSSGGAIIEGTPTVVGGAVGAVTTLSMSGILTHGSLPVSRSSESVNDEASIVLPTGVSGLLWVKSADDEYAFCDIDSDGSVVLLMNSANVVNTDTDGNLCIYDGGTGAVIKNRLGSQKTIRYRFEAS
ncbi:MAG: hypothetical protein HOG49_03095, partial [Candidatus Scalindua sp.]|nr:hypothetical protein [Candidatus Scalindua sp.]